VRVVVSTSVGPGKEYVRQMLPGVLLALAGNAPYPVEFLVTFDGVDPFETLSVAGCCVQSLSREGVDALTIDGRLARMRESQRLFFLARRDFTHLYWHDSDMIPPADVLARLLETDAPLASALYNLRGDHGGQMAVRLAPDGPASAEPASVPVVDGRHVVASAVGMGALLVRRDVLEATAFRSPESYVHREWGEDIRWCLDTGLPVLVDVTLPCWHVAEDGTGTRPTLSVAEQTASAAAPTPAAAPRRQAPVAAPTRAGSGVAPARARSRKR
jgi:hypothetical protein